MIFNQRILIIALVIGLGLHAALIAGIHKITLGDRNMRMLTPEQARAERLKSMKVERSKDDLVVGENDNTPFNENSGNKPDPGKPLPNQIQNLLAQLRVDTATLPTTPAPADNIEKPTDKPGVKQLEGDEPAVEGAAPAAKMTRDILSMTRPNLALPEYKADADTLNIALPGTIFFKPGNIKTTDLKGVDEIAGVGTGTGKNPGGTPGAGKPGTGVGGDKEMKKPKENETVVKITEKPPMKKPEMKKPEEVAKVVPKEEKKVIPKLPDVVTKLPKINPLGDEKADIHLDHDFTYSLYTYRGPVEVPGLFSKPTIEKDGWFEVRIAPKKTLRALKPLKKDVIFAIDASDSINERWLRATRQGVSLALDNLNEGDRFNIMIFRENVTLLDKQSLVIEATADAKIKARAFLEKAEPSGWTDVNQALSRLIIHQTAPDRVYQIILMSDGVPTRGALDPRRIINMITRENSRVAGIYCVGIGDQLDRELLDFLAYRNKGEVIYPKGPISAAGEIRELTGRIRFPLVKDARFNLVGVDRDRVYPQIDRDIYLGDTLSYYGRVGNNRQLSMRLTGTNADQFLDLTFTLPFVASQQGTEKTAKTWAFWKLHHLYSEIARQGKTPALMSAIDEIKKKYGIKAAY